MAASKNFLADVVIKNKNIYTVSFLSTSPDQNMTCQWSHAYIWEPHSVDAIEVELKSQATHT